MENRMYDRWLPHDAGIIETHFPSESHVLHMESDAVSLSEESPLGEVTWPTSVGDHIEALKRAYSSRELADIVVGGSWLLGMTGTVTSKGQAHEVSVSVGGQKLVVVGFAHTGAIAIPFPVRLRDNKAKVEVGLKWGGPCDVNVIFAAGLSYSQIWRVTAPELVGMVWQMWLEGIKWELEERAPYEEE